MTLLEWLEQTPSAQLIGECFAVRDDLADATDILSERAHLLPMSDDTLLNVSLGMALDGSLPVIEWPTADVSNIASWLKTIPANENHTVSMVIRVHVHQETGLDYDTLQHPLVEVWSVLSDSMRSDALARAQSHRKIVILLESATSIAWHKLEGRSLTALTSSSDYRIEHAHCVIVSSNLHADIVQSSIDTLAEDGIRIHWVEQHALSGFDDTALKAVFDVGRVVCVGLPISWLSTLVAKAFWRLESEPTFCASNTPAIQQAVYTSLES